MKYYSHWQPLVDEDAHTALVFGFLRHAPSDLGLAPWLSEVLGRAVQVDPLTAESFWPQYSSIAPGQDRTEPDLALPASDGKDLWVVVEVKPRHDGHASGQLAREVVDLAAGEGARRVALVAIGADIGLDASLTREWKEEVTTELRKHSLDEVDVEVHYSSWAQLGDHIDRVGDAVSSWRIYADDVLTQLESLGLLGYKGVPVFEGLGDFNVVNVVDGYNRIVLAIRQYMLMLHGQGSFKELGLEPYSPTRGYELRRDSTSTVLTAGPDYFTTTSFLCPYRRKSWDEGQGAFVAFFLGEDEPAINAGAFFTRNPGDLVFAYAESEEGSAASDLETHELRGALGQLPEAAAEYETEFRFDARRWSEEGPEQDIGWAVDCLRGACTVWD